VKTAPRGFLVGWGAVFRPLAEFDPPAPGNGEERWCPNRLRFWL